MSDPNEHQDPENSSLLRRILGEEQFPRTPDEDVPEVEVDAPPQEGIVSPLGPSQPDREAQRDPSPISPVRPTVQDDSQPQEPLTPSPPGKEPARPLTPREQMQRAEEALIRLREKMAQVAAEFAEGKLNQAQFDAIYARYSEQRLITERLLARDPESQAWQSVMQPGHTQFLKEHYEARVLSYAIYDQTTFALINLTGTMRVAHTQAEAVLKRLGAVIAQRGNPGPAQKQIGDGRCVLFVPGELTAAVVILSRQPSAAQVQRIEDLHQDFERANQHALRRRDYDPARAAERLVFPHRALFEEQKHHP